MKFQKGKIKDSCYFVILYEHRILFYFDYFTGVDSINFHNFTTFHKLVDLLLTIIDDGLYLNAYNDKISVRSYFIMLQKMKIPLLIIFWWFVLLRFLWEITPSNFSQKTEQYTYIFPRLFPTTNYRIHYNNLHTKLLS